MKTKYIAIVLASLAILVTVGISRAKMDSTEKSFNVKSGGTLYLDSDSGSVRVETHKKDTVEIDVRKKGSNSDDFSVEISQDGNDVRVVGEKENRFFGGGISVRFIIKVPNNYNVDLKTGGGSIDVSDLIGKVDAYTSGGSISLGQINGDVEIKTSGGSIRVEDVAGNIDAHTSGGSIKATISKQPTDDCRLTTSGGSVTAYLSPDIAVDLSASTSGGRVRSEFNVDGTIKKTKIKGAINGGGPDLLMRTSGGSVTIKRL